MSARKWFIMLLCLGSASRVAAQDGGSMLRFDWFMETVRAHHPIAYQADMQPMFGQAAVQAARGGFDPGLFTQVGQKQFNGSEYYSMVDAGLKVPTWIGAEVSAGYEQNRGAYLNPELNTPGAGLWNVGISLPVGQGLIIDRRRAELRKAQLYGKMTEADRQLMLNDLMLEAGRAYWLWARAFAVKQVYDDAVTNANERLRMVKRAAELGDRAFVDTLEASLFLQTLQLSLMQADLDLANSTALLNIFLWKDGQVALELDRSATPQTLEDAITEVDQRLITLLDTLVDQHPELLRSRLKLDQLNIERRFRANQLLPMLNLKYNALNEPVDQNPFADYTIANYRWGLDFSMPLILRKERGELKLAKLAVREAQLGLGNKTAMLDYKARAAINEWTTTREQGNLFLRTARDYRSLLDAEQRMFEAGESSIFMVNARQQSYIYAQVKLMELLAKNREAALKAQHAFGELGNP